MILTLLCTHTRKETVSESGIVVLVYLVLSHYLACLVMVCPSIRPTYIYTLLYISTFKHTIEHVI